VGEIAQQTVVGALGLAPRELVALVGAGGKTSTVRLLGEELTANGASVITTTTTAMLLREMAAVGPVLRQADAGPFVPALKRALAERRRAGVAHADGEEGKVVGLSPSEVDRLWARGLADYIVVEADGSRGLPFKAFGAHEPQVPAAATTIVDVAGLDALGIPLDDGHVHRADTLAAILGVPLGSRITTQMMADGLRAQVVRLRQADARCRILVLLNKAESPEAQVGGLDIARRLLGRRDDAAHLADDGGAATIGLGRPDCVVVGSLHERRFAVLAES
jgi:probable selenium-dependent hydroxylase accessory protein YqeC